MNSNTGWFDKAVALVKENPNTEEAYLLHCVLFSANYNGIAPYLTDGALELLSKSGRRELEKIKRYLKLPQAERDALKPELVAAQNEVMSIVVGFRLEL